MSQVERLKEHLLQFPDMEQVDLREPVDMIDGSTLVSAVLIFKTEVKPPDLNIHVTDNISVDAHVK